MWRKITRLRTSTDHPRKYGENTDHSGSALMKDGPSPQIRGKWRRVGVRRRVGGTIPANTGKMRWVMPCPLCGRDHPREYGENRSFLISLMRRVGPSPRIRGKSHGCSSTSWGGGTIPANTGKMLGSGRPGIPEPDHPREYGENCEY